MWLQDSDGEAGIALVGVHGEYPKYANDDKLFSDKDGAATVGWVYTPTMPAHTDTIDRAASVCPKIISKKLKKTGIFLSTYFWLTSGLLVEM